MRLAGKLGRCSEKGGNMLDVVYLGLGALLFVLMALYARACGRL